MLLSCGVGKDSWESLGLQGGSNQSILKEISPEYSLEGMMLKLKLQYCGYLTQRADSLEKTLMLGEEWKKKEKGMTEDEMVEWHYLPNEHEFEQAPGDGEGQGSLVCYSLWDHKELDMTEQPQWVNISFLVICLRSWFLEELTSSTLCTLRKVCKGKGSTPCVMIMQNK